MHFKHPNILRTSDELSRSNFFLQSITPKPYEMTPDLEKFDHDCSSEVRKMLGCLKCKSENCIFIC